MKKILVTGSAGFIGMHTALKLNDMGYQVVGIDNLNTYYSVQLKLDRLKQQGIDTSQIQYDLELVGTKGILFNQIDITDFQAIDNLFKKHKFDYVVHLAAQAGVRYSIENPHAYIDSNVKGFLNVLEACSKHQVKHLVYASSSSVYGTNEKVPFSEEDQTDSQVSLYAATKKANESMAHSYSSIYNMKTTGLRFFTVYGPWGRPDMALFKFTKKILNDEAIDIYNNGNLSRDFTYIDDIVSGITGIIPHSDSDDARVFNIGCGQPVQLMEFVEALTAGLNKKPELNMMPMQPGDVPTTFANTQKLKNAIGYSPKINIHQGVNQFLNWYIKYYPSEF
jgi:UDP-glucuronate 4-epimerase